MLANPNLVCSISSWSSEQAQHTKTPILNTRHATYQPCRVGHLLSWVPNTSVSIWCWALDPNIVFHLVQVYSPVMIFFGSSDVNTWFALSIQVISKDESVKSSKSFLEIQKCAQLQQVCKRESVGKGSIWIITTSPGCYWFGWCKFQNWRICCVLNMLYHNYGAEED